MNTQESQHVISYKVLGIVLAALLALTGVTVAVSSVDLGVFNVPVALLIASTKATLVLLFFMHMKYESRVIIVSFISAVVFLGILISLMFFDVAFRYFS
ncbi:cytochrome C oxidase subunit IV family protein [Desulfobulbus sp. US1]|nr:cytochrome C oxidase subunit IV family protein [Desulfobulbus sp. US4]MCW5204372.1 cytochrome C oxidase subunit IV family protein [Desulfobulbus sp. N2]MCW5207372.1 cytochrome C oxidase subunit IV family protein [Desulfobulbus sp. US2]MCW5208746.1 cytochrome C oxidase subunit IV family protein [Desulfobulbus sp. US1]MCW5213837.1 cytochrome C oxidase subunit IV family protein [Desulfobulbus sp. US5]